MRGAGGMVKKHADHDVRIAGLLEPVCWPSGLRNCWKNHKKLFEHITVLIQIRLNALYVRDSIVNFLQKIEAFIWIETV